MHEDVLLPCIFGCRGAQDSLNHYLVCSPLWQIASASLCCEAPLHIGPRIGIIDPTPQRLQLLSLCFCIYHYTKSRAKELGGAPVLGSNRIQDIASESARTFLNHVI